MTKKDTRQGKADDLRGRAENAVRMQDTTKTLSPDEAQETLHELRVHQIELEMQNEDLRRTQEELEASRERYFDLYDLAPVGYFTLNERGLILEANLKAAELLGMKRVALVKVPFSHFIHPEDEDRYYLCLKQFSPTSGQNCELRLTRNGPAQCWVRLEITAAEDGDGNPVYRVAISDITERKQAEDALKMAHEELEQRVQERTVDLKEAHDRLESEAAKREEMERAFQQAQKMEALGTLSGGVAHDFNNILAAIIGFTELVAENVPKGSRDAHHLDRVMEASLRGRNLVRQMLTFSRKTEQQKKPLRVSGIVKETVKFIRAAIPATISIRVNILSESDPILADPTQIEQVLMNLCTNAAHAMREKGGTLDIQLTDHSVSPLNAHPDGINPGLYMRLTVRDTGTGISPDIMGKIFDPFFTTKKVGEGTGLGLSVVHGIVTQHGGYITVDSKPGRGSTFTVYFPQITRELEIDAVSDDAIPTGFERILFVDDEEALVEVGKDILAELGYKVTSRMNGREALTLFKIDPSRFDLVITDQTMPEMVGFELAKEILAIRADMPIIMVTGFSDIVDASKAKAAGVKAFAMKPLTKREIAKTIRKVLDE